MIHDVDAQLARLRADGFAALTTSVAAAGLWLFCLPWYALGWLAGFLVRCVLWIVAAMVAGYQTGRGS